MLHLLLSVDYPGVVELRQQAASALVVGRCDCGCPTFDVQVAEDAPLAAVTPPARVSPVELRVSPLTDEPVGEVLLFLDGGRLASVEYVFYVDEPPAEWPEPERLRVLDRR
ncbi:MAG TPA: hypothetical protein VNG13_04310 [Mycobacteriales bacterium]|nr:hypothetical protein [Mycobacteriales bacterium]